MKTESIIHPPFNARESLVLAVIALFGLLGPNAIAEPARPGVFPALAAETLNGDAFTIPADLVGEPQLVLVAFYREHQPDLNRLFPLLAELGKEYSNLKYIEFPVIERLSSAGRWFTDTGMRAGIRDRETRARVVTLYVDRAEWLRATGLIDASRPYVVLTNSSGEVLRAIPSAELRDLASLRSFIAPSLP